MGNGNSLPKEEIMVMSDINEIMKHFVKENSIIWHDSNVHSTENTNFCNELKNICDVQMFIDWKEASEHLKKETQLSYCQIITSGTNGELFVKEISNLPYVSSIYVFCGNINSHKTWAQNYSKVVCVESNFDRLLGKVKESMIKWQRKSSSLRINLPSFASIFDDTDLSETNTLHSYLKGLINFKNRQQAKKDFLTLAKALYRKNQDIEVFETSYSQYNMKAMLNWYTKECFLYKLTNNCLRLANSDSIQYCRLILKDLETAIKDKYRQQSHKFSGLLYRGAYLSDNEWTRLQQNLNKDIEIHGFLSTSKQKNVAVSFCATDMDKKAMITIIVPNFPDKGEQGFAEMKEYSDFSGEEEVLFNVRSRFTVLKASLEEINGVKMRHLVLLYGAQAIRSFISRKSPSIKLKIDTTQRAECQGCKQTIKFANESVVAVNICNNHEYLCKNCIKQSQITKNRLWLVLSLSAHSLLSSRKRRINLKVEGIVMQYKDDLNIPFYGDKCVICQGTKLNCCYKCVDCKDVTMIYCYNCFHDQNRNSCLTKGHMMLLLQGNPFCFWSDRMSENEKLRLKYQEEKLKATNDAYFQQTMIFLESHRYEETIEYIKQSLEKNGESKDFKTVHNYTYLGIAYNNLGEYQKAIEYHSKTLEIAKAVLGEKHPDTADSYNNLGNAYNSLGEYQKAIEYHSKSLEIRKTVLGEKHTSTANSYNNLGYTYYRLEEYQKAIEYHSNDLEIKKTVLGDKHPDIADSYNDLGNAYNNSGEYQKAIEYHSKALEIRKTVLGEKHPDISDSYNNLGIAYQYLEEEEKAIEYHSKALEIRKTVLGEKHPDISDSYNSLGNAYNSLGGYLKAIVYHSKALEISKTVLGEKHPDTANSYNNLGNAYNSLGEYQKAIKYYSKALEIKKAVLGVTHPSTVDLDKALVLSNQMYEKWSKFD